MSRCRIRVIGKWDRGSAEYVDGWVVSIMKPAYEPNIGVCHEYLVEQLAKLMSYQGREVLVMKLEEHRMQPVKI